MLARDRALWTLVFVMSLALLCAPALWNGFPLLQYDTGGYLVRWYEGYLVPSRPAPYGLLLDLGAWWDFWPVVILQSSLTIWIVALVLRTHGLARPSAVLGVIVVLSFLTTLPWLSAILLTDIFCGLGILAFYLLVAEPDSLKRWERYALIALVGYAGSTHSATFAVLLALWIAAAVYRFIDRERFAVSRLRDGAVAVALGAVLMLAANFIVSGKVAWTPGGASLLFGRMLQDGIVKRYLDEHCPDRKLTLCQYRAELPRDADLWFWGSKLFDRLGRFDGLGGEMEHIAFTSLRDYPLLQAETALAATAGQLAAVHTGEGVVYWVWHSYGMMQRYTPWVMPALDASRQMKRQLDFTLINRLHYPVALLSLALLPLIVFLMRAQRFRAVRDFAAVMSLAVLANAAVCGIFSNPHDRYGARIVWLAAFAVAAATMRLAVERPVVTALDPAAPAVR
jgi:hypothetical protein